MAKNSNKSSHGFTIIEILIVLAIAGLIILVVLLAVPSLRAVERDHQRKRDLTKFLAALMEYKSSHGVVNAPFVINPTYTGAADVDHAAFDLFKVQYLGPEFAKYDVRLFEDYANHTFPYVEDLMILFPRHYCSTNNVEEVSGPGIHPPYAFSVLVALERIHDYICIDQGSKDLNEL